MAPGEWLVNQADQEVQLTIRRGGDPPRTVSVKALPDERPAPPGEEVLPGPWRRERESRELST